MKKLFKKILYIVGIGTALGAGWLTLKPDASTFNYAALGDSTTTAFNSKEAWNNPAYSWATGEEIESHLKRLRKVFPDREIVSLNIAFPGMREADLERQVDIATTRRVDYATILMGSNDLCHKTPVDEYKAGVEKAVNRLIHHNPKIKILISSIPDIVQSRRVEKPESCDPIWKKVMEMCDVSDEERFYKAWGDMNLFLEKLAIKNEQVKFSDAIMTTELTTESISEIDCFHPSLLSQERIAELTWNQGWFK